MSDSSGPTLEQRLSGATWKVVFAGAALAAVAAIGVVLVVGFVADERERDLGAWQIRMGIVADSRFAAVDDWIDRQYTLVRELAENASLQLYVTELAMFAGDASQVTDEPAQRTYLRNLLVAAADAGGFSAALRGPQIDANVERVGVAGLAIVDNQARVLVATPGMPPVEGPLEQVVASSRGKRSLYDLHIAAGGQPTMGFVAPIFAIQSDQQASDRIGAVVGVKEVGAELFPLLVQPGAIASTAEAVIVRGGEDTVEYLSPLADGTAPLRRTLDRTTPDLAAAFALDAPGGFATRHDYRGNEVLVLARRFTTVPWTLMYKIDAAEALAETDSRFSRMLTVFLLIIAAVAAALVAAWRHGTSRRASEAAREARETAERFEEQRDFLHLITDTQPGAMAIIDGDGRYLWANRKLWENADLERDEVIGKTLSTVVGPVPAKELLGTIRAVLESGAARVETHSEGREGAARTFQSQFVPLAAAGDMPARVLVASEDITSAIGERAKRERIMNQLVGVLVGVVDRRDPCSANHSAWVAVTARAMAGEMELDPADVDCVEVAGRLMNLGKILVPEELLTKTEPLTDEELALIRNSIATSADLLDGVEFTGPVVETLRQLAEDVTGGKGSDNGEGEVMPSTRIVAIANAFVALVSPRAYRAGLSIDAALDTLLSKMSAGENRRVVVALASYLDNHGGRAALADIGEKLTVS